jgi:hypothetical protein
MERDKKGKFVKGHKQSNTGRTHFTTERMSGDKNPAKRPEIRLKISLASIGRKISPLQGFQKGKKHWNWKGGATSKDKLLRLSKDFKHWREDVFKGDNYTCWICEDRGGNGHKVILHPHHLKGFAEYPKLRFKVSNGMTLCDFCHKTYTDFGVNKRFTA